MPAKQKLDAFQLGLDSYNDEWSQAKITNTLTTLIYISGKDAVNDFERGRKVAISIDETEGNQNA